MLDDAVAQFSSLIFNGLSCDFENGDGFIYKLILDLLSYIVITDMFDVCK